jgi:hypothetical protein
MNLVFVLWRRIASSVGFALLRKVGLYALIYFARAIRKFRIISSGKWRELGRIWRRGRESIAHTRQAREREAASQDRWILLTKDFAGL